MRRVASVVIAVAGVLVASGDARADGPPDGSAALQVAAAIEVTGMIVGGAVVATGHGHAAIDNAGWLGIESAFVVAPIAAHGVVSEWARGGVFALAPACALAATAVLFAREPDTIESGTLPQQRWMWSFFSAGLLTSALGAVDVLWAPARAQGMTLAPTVGAGQIGLRIGGSL